MKISFICLCFLFSSVCFGQNIDKIASEVAKMNLIISQTVSKDTVFAGEAFYCDYYLTVNEKLILTDLKISSLPSFISFKSQEIKIDELNYRDTVIDNYKFKKALLHRFLLFSNKSGTFNVDSIKFDVTVKIPFDEQQKNQNYSQFSDKYYEYSYSASSNSKLIQIIPLPANKKNISGTQNDCVFVGDFDIDYNLSRITAQKNENVLLNVNISGNGYLGIPFVPTVAKSEGLKTNIYRTFDTFYIENQEILSTKVYEIDLLSSIGGEFSVFPIEILCFSPTKKEFYTLKTEPINLFFVEKEATVNKKNDKFNFIDIVLLIVILGIISLIIIIFYYQKHIVRVVKKTPQNTENLQKKVQTNQNSPFNSDISAIYLSKAFTVIDEDIDIFLKELNIGIEEYIKERFQVEKELNSKEKIVEKLKENGISDEIAQNYLLIISKIEEIRFSKMKLERKIQQELEQKLFILAENFLNKLENSL